VVGLKKTRDAVHAAAGRVTASTEMIAKAIGAVAGIAAVALCVALLAVVLAVRGRRPAIAA